MTTLLLAVAVYLILGVAYAAVWTSEVVRNFQGTNPLFLFPIFTLAWPYFLYHQLNK